MTFQEIANRWNSATSVRGKVHLLRSLFETEAGWLQASVACLKAGGQAAGLVDLLKWAGECYRLWGDTEGYLVQVARAHIACAEVAACARRLRDAGSDKNSSDTATRELIGAAAEAAWPGCDTKDIDVSAAAGQLQQAWQAPGSAAVDPADRAFRLLPEKVRQKVTLPIGFLRDLTALLQERANEGTGAGPTPRPRAPVATVSAHFVTVPTQPTSQDKVTDQVFKFNIEVLGDGAGEVYMAPEQAFVPWESDFRRSLDAAKDAAKAYQKQAKYAAGYDFRFRLAESNYMYHLKGSSAGGAFARALYFAMTGEAADDEVIVLASVCGGMLYGVRGVHEKVEAILGWNSANNTPRFDTIVVASRANHGDAVNALGAAVDVRVLPNESEL